MKDTSITFKVDGGAEREIRLRRVKIGTWGELKNLFGWESHLQFIAALIAENQLALSALIWMERKVRQPDLRWNTVLRELDARDESPDVDILKMTVDGEVIFEAASGDDPEDISLEDDRPTTAGA